MTNIGELRCIKQTGLNEVIEGMLWKAIEL